MYKTGKITLICIILFLAGFGALSNSQADELSDLRNTVDSYRQDISKWAQQKTIMLFMVCSIGILGIILIPLQKVDKPYIKTVTIIIGCLISSLTLVKEKTFSVDHKELAYRINKARKLMLEIDMELPRMPTDEIAKNQWYEKIKGKLARILELSERSYLASTAPSKNTAGILPFLQTRAEREPLWLRQPLADPANIYFIGIGEGYSLLQAEEYARMQTQENMKGILKDYLNIDPAVGPDYAPQQTPMQQTTAGPEIEDFYFFKDPETNRYRYYSLFRLNLKKIMLELKFRQIKGEMSFQENPSRAISFLQEEAPLIYMRSLHDNENLIAVSLAELNREQYEMYMEARLQRQRNFLDEAFASIQPVLEEKPDFFFGWFELALLSDSAGRLDEAAAAYEKAAQLFSGKTNNFFYEYGKFLKKQGNYPEAAGMFHKVLEIDPKNNLVHRILEKLR